MKEGKIKDKRKGERGEGQESKTKRQIYKLNVNITLCKICTHNTFIKYNYNKKR
jgi:hypothetical protein